jgi:hypothetical protein
MNRRAFLKAAAAAPCVFGLRDLFAQEADVRPAWFKQALGLMKERKLHGVVVVVPGDDPAQKRVGTRLWSYIEGEFPKVHELFLTSVFIFLTPAAAEACGVRKANEDATRFLLDPEGKRVAADAPALKSFSIEEEFLASYDPFIHGEHQERLKDLGLDPRTPVPDKVIAAIRDLGADDLATREVASAALLEGAKDCIPFLAWRRRTTADPEVASRLLRVIGGHFRGLAKSVPPRLPFGTRVPKFADRGCGSMREVAEDEAQPERPGVACGMGRIGEETTREFLRFLTK